MLFQPLKDAAKLQYLQILSPFSPSLYLFLSLSSLSVLLPHFLELLNFWFSCRSLL